MLRYSNLTSARQVLAGTKKWDRTFEAIAAAESLPSGITFSVGDSLTWRRIDGENSDPDFIQSIRYLRVLYCASGTAEIAVLRGGQMKEPYSDLTDRMLVEVQSQRANSFGKAPEVIKISIQPGNLVIFDAPEATQLFTSRDFSGVQLRVTVEGISFHNK